jgi:copper chaperone CopZ
MTTTRQYRTNLNCGSCVAAVKPLLDTAPGIHHWQVDTGSPDKTLTVAGDDVGQQRVGELVGRAGFKVLGEVQAQAATPAEEEPSRPATTYYPLALLLAFLLGLVALAEWRAGAFDWMRAMNDFMGGFFVAFSFFKLLDVRAFADAYAGYDILARRSRAYALAYPFVELALGVAYLAGLWPLATNLATLAVMSVGSVGVIQSLLDRRKIRCVCLGAVFNLPMSTVTLLEDGLMAAMAAVMILRLALA